MVKQTSNSEFCVKLPKIAHLVNGFIMVMY